MCVCLPNERDAKLNELKQIAASKTKQSQPTPKYYLAKFKLLASSMMALIVFVCSAAAKSVFNELALLEPLSLYSLEHERAPAIIRASSFFKFILTS